MARDVGTSSLASSRCRYRAATLAEAASGTTGSGDAGATAGAATGPDSGGALAAPAEDPAPAAVDAVAAPCGSVAAGTSGSPIDPLLEPLTLNGGQIPTHRPISDPATPVVDKGFCTGSGADQRGFGDAVAHVRIVDTAAPNGPGSDGCDIGAYERGGAAQAAPLLFADDFESGYDLYWDAAMP